MAIQHETSAASGIGSVHGRDELSVKVLEIRASRQSQDTRVMHSGLLRQSVIQSFAFAPLSDEARRLERVIRHLVHEGLIEEKEQRLRLTSSGWVEVAGGVPGQERDDEFISTLVRLHHDPFTRRERGLIPCRLICESIGWSVDGNQVVGLVERLIAEGLAWGEVSKTGSALLPTRNALERFSA